MKKLPTHRPTRLDVSSAIFRPNVDVVEETNDIHDEVNRQYICYTVFGKHDGLDPDGLPVIDEDENNPEVFAKTVYITGKAPMHFIKSTRNGHFFDPLGIDRDNHLKVASKTGRREYEFIQVNKKVFGFYVHFLKTKNHAHLRTAQREHR